MRNRFLIPVLLLLALSCSVAQFLAKFPEPAFSVEFISMAPGESQRIENGEVVIKLQVKRLGPAGTCRLTFQMDNQRCEEEFKVRGDSRNFYLTCTFPAGWHTLEIDNTSFTFYVQPAEVSENAQIEITSFEVEPMDAKLWETAFVRVTLANRSDVAGRRKVRVWAENSPLEKEVVVPAGTSVDTYFPVTLNKLLLRVWVENCTQPQENLRPGIL
jgi:hypothetical protein